MNNTDRNEADLQWLAGACTALGHPARARIMAHLKDIDRCECGDLVDLRPLAPSTVSRHL